MGYSTNSGHVRGDLFTETGKWKYSVVIDMSNYYDVPLLTREAVVEAFHNTDQSFRGVRGECKRYWLVVLEPYHRNSYPIATRL